MKCDGCRYSTPLMISGRIRYACYYLMFRYERRPCPAGDDCKVFEPLPDGGRLRAFDYYLMWRKS